MLLDLDIAALLPPVNKPLRFEASWLTCEEFNQVFSNAWNLHSNYLPHALQETSKACSTWGKSVFGNIFRRKQLLRARIASIQNSPYYQTSNRLRALKKELLREDQQVLYEEELLWLQKSKVD